MGISRDTEDVAVADPQFSAEHKNVHYLIMRRPALEVRFPAADSKIFKSGCASLRYLKQ
jgi:hypothetical protein